MLVLKVTFRSGRRQVFGGVKLTLQLECGF
jgi:hypothetical protein